MPCYWPPGKDVAQGDQALVILKPLFESREEEVALNALRLATSIRLKRFNGLSTAKDEASRKELIPDIRKLFDRLLANDKSTVADVYQYGDFLLRTGQAEDLPAWINRMDKMAPGSFLTINLRLRLAKAEGRTHELLNWQPSGQKMEVRLPLPKQDDY